METEGHPMTRHHLRKLRTTKGCWNQGTTHWETIPHSCRYLLCTQLQCVRRHATRQRWFTPQVRKAHFLSHRQGKWRREGSQDLNATALQDRTSQLGGSGKEKKKDPFHLLRGNAHRCYRVQGLNRHWESPLLEMIRNSGNQL